MARTKIHNTQGHSRSRVPKKGCECWWCRNARGENKPTREFNIKQRFKPRFRNIFEGKPVKSQ